MPGSIHLIVLDAFDLPEAAGDGVSIKASMGKKQFVTEVFQPAAGRAGPWEDEHAFSVMSLTDHLIISLLDAKGESLGSAQVTTPSIVEKGFRDEALLMKDKKGASVGRVHVKLSFVLSDEERKRIETMRAKSLAKKGGADGAPSPPDTPSTGLNGRRAIASRASVEKALSNGESVGASETAAVMAAVGAEVDAQVAHASTAAMQAAADVAQQAKEAAASPTSDSTTTTRAERMARKAADTAEKAGGVAATAANGARAKGKAVAALTEAETGKAGTAAATLERVPSVKDRVKAFEVPERTSSKGTPARSGSLTKSTDENGSTEIRSEEGGSEDEAAAVEDDWARVQAVEARLRRTEEQQRAEDAARVGREAEEAKRYEQEYREQRVRREEYLRHEEERKQEQEEQRASKAAAAARKEAAREQEEGPHAEGTERDDDDSEEGGRRNVWQQVAGTVAFGVALFMLWPRDTRGRVASKRRGNVSGGKYVVRKGDTLDTIVGRMCYNPDSDFYKLNPGVCDRNTIYPGQVLQVPEYL